MRRGESVRGAAYQRLAPIPPYVTLLLLTPPPPSFARRRASLLRIVKGLVRVVESERGRVEREIEDWKGRIEDSHKVEVARLKRSVEMEKER